MSWKDTLRPATFKGIEFRVAGHESEFGRRTVTNEYAYRDTPYTEDMGRKARRYEIAAYLIDTDYTVTRDSIIDAVEAGGVGTLIHPYLGTKQVVCENLRVRETREEGGFVSLSFTFVEAGQRIFPDSAAVPKDLVSISADNLIDAARTNFIEKMTVTGVSEWVRDEWGDTLGDLADIFDTVRTNGGINNQTTTDLINKAAVWVADVSGIKVPPLSLLTDTAAAADRLISIMQGTFDLAPTPEEAVNNLNRFTDFVPVTLGGTSVTGKVAVINQQASQTFIRTIALANEAKALVQQTFESYEEAISGREQVLERIDSVMDTTEDDEIYNFTRSLRADVAKAVPDESESLPRISTHVLKQSLPSLVMAYDLYESVDREQDIIKRNNVRHPGYLPGGTDLSILEDEQSRA